MPLSGVTVLDLSQQLPGPLATLLLAERGARVIRLEPPEGDRTRAVPPLVDGVSAWERFLGRGKESIVLDLKTPGGQAAARRIAGRADVLVSSFRPGVLGRLGLAPDELVAAHPRLVVCELPGFPAGRDAGRAMHDLGLVSLAGIADLNRGVPGVQIADCAAGMRAAFEITAAVLAARDTGRGRRIEVPLLDAARLLSAVASLEAQAGGHSLLTGDLACYRLYRCADGRELALSGLEPKFFGRVCNLIGRPELAASQYDLGRQPELARELEGVFAGRPRTAWMELLGGDDTCVAEVLAPAEAIPPPLAAAGSDLAPPRPLGADTARVLAEFGC
jgi:crotonobetainyl-CoA:carnitine CoA-transferase CaiB-like acyl-CoA transferase